jgi:hypothetical protein
LQNSLLLEGCHGHCNIDNRKYFIGTHAITIIVKAHCNTIAIRICIYAIYTKLTT